MQNYLISELLHLYQTKTLQPAQVLEHVAAMLTKHQVLNAVVTRVEGNHQFPLDQPLSGIPFIAKDNFTTKGIKTTASSAILANFIPPYSATVIIDLQKAGAVLMAKSALDELGMGGHGLYAATGPVLNPWDHTRIPGGSSSGSAALVAAGVAPFALGTDTGDSIRKPAAYCGIVGYKPTYGLISRYGVIPYAPSLDTVGYFTRSVQDAWMLAPLLCHYDPFDFTSSSRDITWQREEAIDWANLTIGYFKLIHASLPPAFKLLYQRYFDLYEQQGAKIVVLEFPYELWVALYPIYMIISYSEAISTHSNLDGINFGVRHQGADYSATMKQSRAKGFGLVVQRRFVLGSYFLARENQSLLLLKAKKVRRLIVAAYRACLDQVDIIIMPPANDIAPKQADVYAAPSKDDQLYNIMNNVLVLANLAGTPSLTIPLGKIANMPVGINFNSASFRDQLLFQLAQWTEAATKLKNDYVGADHD